MTETAENLPEAVTKTRSPNRKPRTRKDNPKARKIDVHKALELKVKGATYEEVSSLFNCTKQAVMKALKPYAAILDGSVEDFKHFRADLFAVAQRELLQSITDAEIKKMSVKDRIVATGILYDKERLERGQSTSNLSIMTRAVEAACEVVGE